MTTAAVTGYNQCPVCRHPGSLRHYLWPTACRQCGEMLLFGDGNPWVFFLKNWAALPVILLLVERKPPMWLGAAIGVGIYLLMNVCLWCFCRLAGRPEWFSGRLQKYQKTPAIKHAPKDWKRFGLLVLLVLAGLMALYLLMQIGLRYSPIGNR
ncbi:hypothetical protein [Simiduia agarivorans]|uniref:Uncharacterized protein n=1 Tax=Simiduia agarivorans (strain DSM 21679 / JCM 13881 / BCRC 17597 / SA1) TaxID=1117647 RepID=K4KJW2_SIMAS|nr:hypothetical protein [Simiduia agarivorans]AFU99281.2 hypothetical protein M5M_10500 [Simiduia agarivorans SA1 = DSM 21679]